MTSNIVIMLASKRVSGLGCRSATSRKIENARDKAAVAAGRAGGVGVEGEKERRGRGRGRERGR